MTPRFITAIATPLHEDDTLHNEGLEYQVSMQLKAGIAGLLIGGTMGAMQLLTEETYRQLFTRTTALARGRCELLGGAGDTSFSRTRERIAFLNELPLDGVVVLPPFFMQFSQDEVIDYYQCLAQESRLPLFLYDQPMISHCKLEIETVLKLAQHPNIMGIKCSDEPTYARQLIDRCPADFRVVLAAPLLMDVFLRHGIMEHLDGIFCVCPRQVVELGRACSLGHWDRATQIQQDINRMVQLLRTHGVWTTFTALMNALGLPGQFKPRPHRQWDERETQRFLESAETQAVLHFLQNPVMPVAVAAVST
jgi:4-hydroxy-tetrahydrodipicolinate synthase